jgi:hypothetical protein
MWEDFGIPRKGNQNSWEDEALVNGILGCDLTINSNSNNNSISKKH